MWPPEPARQEHLSAEAVEMFQVLYDTLGRPRGPRNRLRRRAFDAEIYPAQVIWEQGRPHRAAPTKGGGLYLAQRPSGSIWHPLSRIIVGHCPERHRPSGSA
jgi:hypothetical protein